MNPRPTAALMIVGYILWSGWLVVFAVMLRQRRRAGEAVVTGAPVR